MTAPIPMSVLGGFLGAGKTTLRNRILSGSHGVRYAVLVNDFGELAIDGRLVAAHDGETVTFANGCVCCSMGDDLVGTLDRLLDGDRPPEHIVVEASGVADPRAIADVATLHPGLERDLVVVLADVQTVRARHEDHRLRDTVRRQLEAADLLVLNKCDNASEKDIGETETWARDRSQAPAIRSVGADIPMELLCASRWKVLHAPAADENEGETAAAAHVSIASEPRAGAHPPAPRVRRSAADPEAPGFDPAEPRSPSPVRTAVSDPAAHDHDTDRGHGVDHDHSPDHTRRFASRFVPCADPVDPGRLRAALSALLPRVLRAKGFVVTTRGAHQEWMVVQACGRTVGLEPWRPPADAALPAPGIVCIGLDDLPSADELAAALGRASSESSPAIRAPVATDRAT